MTDILEPVVEEEQKALAEGDFAALAFELWHLGSFPPLEYPDDVDELEAVGEHASCL